MNDIFNFKRFGLLLKKIILERPVQLMGITGLILVATLVIYALCLYFLSFQPAQNLAYIWGLVGGGCFLSSVVFGYFNTNAQGSAYLTLPASAFEKWLCGMLIAGIFFPCIFLAFYKLMDMGFVTAYHNGLDKNNPAYKEMYNSVQYYPLNGNVAKQSAVLFVNFTGAMMVGSLYFNRIAAIKTALVYFAALGVIYFLNLLLAYSFFKGVDEAFPFHDIFIRVKNDIGSIELPHSFSNTIYYFFAFIIPGMLWITTLIRLREKEI
ncbi:MAG: hypothetical protein ACHQF4_11005 [Sphingobacteriales bacterium]